MAFVFMIDAEYLQPFTVHVDKDDSFNKVKELACCTLNLMPSNFILLFHNVVIDDKSVVSTVGIPSGATLKLLKSSQLPRSVTSSSLASTSLLDDNTTLPATVVLPLQPMVSPSTSLLLDALVPNPTPPPVAVLAPPPPPPPKTEIEERKQTPEQWIDSLSNVIDDWEVKYERFRSRLARTEYSPVLKKMKGFAEGMKLHPRVESEHHVSMYHDFITSVWSYQ